MPFPCLNRDFRSLRSASDLLAALGESYFMAGKVDKAIEEFKKLLEIEPPLARTHFLGSPIATWGGSMRQSNTFSRVLKLDPHNSLCLFNLGFIAERQGDAAGAEALFPAGTSIQSRFPDALLELANLRIAAKKLRRRAELLKTIRSRKP